MEPSADTLLNNRYQIIRMLGQGGMGAVYLALDTALDTSVAVKVNRNISEQSAAQFLREARLLASLRHPNLPRVTDYFILEGAQYLVMDYIAGRDLETVLKEEGVQPLERVLDWGRQVGLALSYLHNQVPPVIHRDVKPANVRLSTEGAAILVDFGIAKVVDANQQTTRTGASAYTPGYAPPEQYGGTVRTGPYTDQYSLAALMYHMITGQKPADSLQRAIGGATLTPVSSLVRGVPANIDSALQQALSLRPNERFPSIDDFLRALAAPGMSRQPDMDRTVLTPPPVESTVLEQRTQSQQYQQAAPPSGSAAAVQPLGDIDAPPAPLRKRGGKAWLAGLGAVIVLGLAAAAVLLGGQLLTPPAPPTRVAQAAATASPIPTSETPRPAQAATSTPLSAETETQSPSPRTATAEPAVLTETPASSTDTPIPAPAGPALGGGGLIAFSSNRADGKTFQIWTMRVALNDQGAVLASDLVQLTNSEGSKTQPAWSPDGKRLVYVAPGGPDQKLDLWVMNADGSGEPQDITNLKGNELQPAWSPDGKLIAFTGDSRSDKALQVYLVRPDGKDLNRLSYDQYEFSPAWAPDLRLGFVMNASGLQIVFLRGQVDPKTGATPTKPYYVTPVRFDLRSFTDNLGQAADLNWSADGQWLAYTRERGTSKYIGIAHNPIRVVAQDVLRLTDSGKDTHPAWSPDAQWIVFTSERDGNPEIYIMRATGKLQSNLTSDAAIDKDPAWQPAVH